VAFPELGDAAEEQHARRVASALGLKLDVVPGELEPWHPEDDLRTSVVPYLTPPALAADTALARLAAAEVNVALDGNDGDGVLGYLGREWAELLRTGRVRRLVELSREHGSGQVLHKLINDVVPPALRFRKLRGRPEPPPTYLQLAERYFAAPLRLRMRRIDHERWR